MKIWIWVKITKLDLMSNPMTICYLLIEITELIPIESSSLKKLNKKIMKAYKSKEQFKEVKEK